MILSLYTIGHFDDFTRRPCPWGKDRSGHGGEPEFRKHGQGMSAMDYGTCFGY